MAKYTNRCVNSLKSCSQFGGSCPSLVRVDEGPRPRPRRTALSRSSEILLDDEVRTSLHGSQRSLHSFASAEELDRRTPPPPFITADASPPPSPLHSSTGAVSPISSFQPYEESPADPVVPPFPPVDNLEFSTEQTTEQAFTAIELEIGFKVPTCTCEDNCSHTSFWRGKITEEWAMKLFVKQENSEFEISLPQDSSIPISEEDMKTICKMTSQSTFKR